MIVFLSNFTMLLPIKNLWVETWAVTYTGTWLGLELPVSGETKGVKES
jgi:hypothetical protein